MAGNATPQFCKNGTLGTPVVPSVANTDGTGGGTIGTNLFVVLTSDATNGTYVDEVQFTPQASVVGSTTTATIARLFACSAAGGAVTSANCHLIKEVALPVITTADSATIANNEIVVPLGIRLPPAWTLLVSNHAAPAANTGWKTMAKGGDY